MRIIVPKELSTIRTPHKRQGQAEGRGAGDTGESTFNCCKLVSPSFAIRHDSPFMLGQPGLHGSLFGQRALNILKLGRLSFAI